MSKRPRSPIAEQLFALNLTELFPNPPLLCNLGALLTTTFRGACNCVELPGGLSAADTSARRSQLLGCPANTTVVVFGAETRERTALALGLSLDELLVLARDREMRVVTHAWLTRCLQSLRDGFSVDVALAAVQPDGILPLAALPLPRSSPVSEAVGAAADTGGSAVEGASSSPAAEGAASSHLGVPDSAAADSVSPVSSPLVNASAWRLEATDARLVENRLGFQHIALPRLQELLALAGASSARDSIIRIMTANVHSLVAQLKKPTEKDGLTSIGNLIACADLIAMQETNLSNTDISRHQGRRRREQIQRACCTGGQGRLCRLLAWPVSAERERRRRPRPTSLGFRCDNSVSRLSAPWCASCRLPCAHRGLCT